MANLLLNYHWIVQILVGLIVYLYELSDFFRWQEKIKITKFVSDEKRNDVFVVYEKGVYSH